MFTGPLFQINTHLVSTVLLSGFQSSPGVWNPLSKAVPGKFHGSGGHNHCNCLHDRANFHRSHGWLIFQLFNTGTCNTLTPPSPQDKMTAISQTIFSDAFSWMKSFVFWLKVVPKGPIDNNTALVEIMAWRRIGDKLLSQLMLTRFIDACMRHKGEMCQYDYVHSGNMRRRYNVTSSLIG